MVCHTTFAASSRKAWLAQETKRPTTYREGSQSGVGCQAYELASYANFGCDEGYDGIVVVILLRAVLQIGASCASSHYFCPEYYYRLETLANAEGDVLCRTPLCLDPATGLGSSMLASCQHRQIGLHCSNQAYPAARAVFSLAVSPPLAWNLPCPNRMCPWGIVKPHTIGENRAAVPLCVKCHRWIGMRCTH
jgi:hypothetical protein